MNAPHAALAIDLASDQLRALRLTAVGHGAASVSAFAAVARPETTEAIGAAALKLTEALSLDNETPVRLIDSTGVGHDALAACVAALNAFDAQVSSLTTEDAVQRAVGDEEPVTRFVGCEVPTKLLDAHPDLDLRDLAPAAGAALYELALYELDRAGIGEAAMAPADADRPDDFDDETHDVFSATPAVVAGSAAAASAAAAATFFSDDDETFFDDNEAVSDETTDGSVFTPAAPVAAAPISATPATASTSDSSAPQSTREPLAPASGDTKHRGIPAWLWGLAALIAIAALVAWLVLGSDSGSDVAVDLDTDPVTTAVETAPTEAPESTEATQPLPDSEPTAEPTAEPTEAPDPTAEPTLEPTAEPTPDPLAGLPPLSELPAREAVFRPPNLYLSGPATEDDAARSYARALEVLPAENIVNELIIRPDAPEATGGTVRIEQAVQFGVGSATIAQPFLPTLELGVQLMAVNPEMSMVIEGHTDNVGAEALNLELSQRRASAVVQYLVSRGIDPARLSAVGLGSTEPVAPNDTEEGRRVNRRIEVNMIDLLLPRDGD